ncbi:unnamed protein product [Candidula unifasciata]|uniref:Aminotransferase class I/classII large domain-containing protein n=1 Tax=Candidula unifasciata TaxID=100452 RepID=A0A8S3YZ07_9EUPU|nr:unnamed protein product [Candidula unifasciata]
MEKSLKDSSDLTELRILESGPDNISFSPGSPGTETLRSCSGMLRTATLDLLTQDADVDSVFKYGPVGGHKKILHRLSEFLTEEYGSTVDCSDLMLTAGATQGLHMILSLLCQQSCPVFIEDPSYFYGFRMIRDDLCMNLVPVPSDESGINTDILEKLLTTYKPADNTDFSDKRYWAVVYLIPVFGNPTGYTYSEERCEKLIQMARRHDVLIVAEDVYNLLYFTDTSSAPPRLISFDKKTDPDYGRGHVISNGTFSKIFAPSLRLGWIEGPVHLISYLTLSNLSYSGGCFNQYASKLMECVLRSGALQQHVSWLRKTYKKRMDALFAVLDESSSEGLSFHRPEGGFFLWLKLRPDVDAFEFLRFAAKNFGVSFLPGICSSPTGSFRNWARLSISSNSTEDVQEGARRLCLAYQEFIARTAINS